MKFEITLDETILKDLFEGTIGDPEKLNRVTRMQRHILIWSKELVIIWRKLEGTDLFRKNPTIRLTFQNWITMLTQKPNSFRRVRVDLSRVQGEPKYEQRVVFGTAYQSADKIVIGDFPEQLRTANSVLTFVSRDAFSRTKPSRITWEQVKIVLARTNNMIEDIFDIFETPISLEVPKDSESELLANYLARFYDDQLVIQDDYFVQNDENEGNFVKYVLTKVQSDCDITLRVGINDALRERGYDKQSKYESMTEHKVSVNCIDRRGENLHDGYFESSKYRVSVPYRLGIFGRNGKNRLCMIFINSK